MNRASLRTAAQEALHRAIREHNNTKLSNQFLKVWKGIKGPKLEAEVQFDPSRKFRFDFALAGVNAPKIAIEIEGGLWVKSRHRTGTGYLKDIQKYNLALMQGWRVVRLAEPMLTVAYLEKVRDWIQDQKGTP